MNAPRRSRPNPLRMSRAPVPPGTPHNRLAREKSPYLLQHRHNPVDWFPWGGEAFAKARAENKPVFLSVGYSTCHWCHVMAGESFENPAIAAVMNAGFVNVKVDREERPDVDRLYMTFVQATSGHGGWPMSVWMTPEGAPFLGGTYFPPEDRHGRRGFPAMLRAIADAWRTDREALTTRGAEVLDALREMAARGEPGGGDARLPDAGKVLRKGFETFAAEFDPEWGGFGAAPKFPRPSVLHLLARVHARAADVDAQGATARRVAEMLTVTLDRMAAGGMNDQLGGGFHRYSVDRRWHVPHFEKMLYDQAQLVTAYLEGYQITGNGAYADTVRATLGYVLRDLTGPAGGFLCAEDADSPLPENPAEHAEGAFYVWTEAEIGSVLTVEETRLANFHFGVETAGNAPPGSDPQEEFVGKNILLAHRSLDGTAAQFGMPIHRVRTLLELAREKLFHARKARPRPHLDDKVLTGWNGLMISAFARAYGVLDELRFLRPALAAAAFVRANLHQPEVGTLRRSYREGASDIAGFADDYAFFIQGLLDLYEADFDLEHLLWAERLQDTMDRLFFDEENGGYFSTAAGEAAGGVLIRLKDDHDGAEPAAGSVAAMNLVRLAASRGRADLRERAARTLGASRERLEQLPQAMPAMAGALDAFVRSPRQIVLAGDRGAPDLRALLRAARRPFRPGQVLLYADGGDAQRQLGERLPFLADVRPVDGRAAAYVCEDGTCQLPVTEPATLETLP